MRYSPNDLGEDLTAMIRPRLNSRLLSAATLACGLLTASGAWAQGPPPRLVPDRYIVVFRDRAVADPAAAAAQLSRAHGLGLGRVYGAALKGFSAVIPPARLPLVANDPRVAYVEPDQVFEVAGRLEALGRPGGGGGGGGRGTQPAQVVPIGIHRIGADQKSATARIDGIDERVAVNVAVIDTGIDQGHADLNILGGYNATSSRRDRWDDGHGHGTHVSGTIAALDNAIGVVGVAPGAGLYGVKVLDDRGSGATSWIVAGIDWVVGNADSKGIKVANMSFGGGYSQAILDAVDRLVAAGVVVAVAAGNSSADCRSSSPANSLSDGVLTTSALVDTDGLPGGYGPAAYGPDDWIATFSNNGRNEAVYGDPFGNGVDVIGPGVNVYSTYKGNSYATMSGTSMASPHVAGVAALYVATHAGETPAEVRGAVLTSSGYYAVTGDDIIYGLGDWRALGGDNDSGGTTYMDPYGYEPLPDAAAF